MSEWTDYVKKQYVQMKKTMKNVKLGDAMKKAAKMWKNRGTGSSKKMYKRKTMRKYKKRGGSCAVQQPIPVPAV
jgi:hypothetical protein